MFNPDMIDPIPSESIIDIACEEPLLLKKGLI